MSALRNSIRFAVLFGTVLLYGPCAWSAVIIHERGSWPRDWPVPMEGYRFQAKTFGIGTGIQENVHEIRFTEREEFERIWPTILELKSRGAPLRLRSIEKPAGAAKGLFATDRPVVRIYAPSHGSSARRPGGPMLPVGPPWPKSVRSSEGLLPEYVVASEDGTKWVPATEGGPTGFKHRARIEIELVVDGVVIDLNRICLPRETPILDERQAPQDSEAGGVLARLVRDYLTEIQAIKPGDTRGRLMQVFRTEGGISNRRQRRYVHKDCPLIKVDVRFNAVDQDKEEKDADVIASISQPFIEWSIMD
jgi:hypothetical protein